MDEDGGKQAEDSRRSGRWYVEENYEVLEDVGENRRKKKESEETLELVELVEVEVNEEEVERRTEGEAQFEEDGGDLDSEEVGTLLGTKPRVRQNSCSIVVPLGYRSSSRLKSFTVFGFSISALSCCLRGYAEVHILSQEVVGRVPRIVW